MTLEEAKKEKRKHWKDRGPLLYLHFITGKDICSSKR